MNILSAKSFCRQSGFTLLELLITVAIIAILVVVLAPIVIDNICYQQVNGAKATIEVCKVAIAQANIQNVVDCLQQADKTLKELAKKPECFEKYRSAIVTAADEINSKVDELKANTDISAEDKERLEKAKISVPAKDAGTK